MPYRDIQAPIVGDKQILNVNGADTVIDLQTYLLYLNDNISVTHGDQSPIYINNVVGETQNLPVITAANAQQFNGIAVVLTPIVFPTAGTIRKSFTTNNKPGMITSILTATFTPVVVQASVIPAIAIGLEYQQVGGNWVRALGTDPIDNFSAHLQYANVAGNVYTLSIVKYFTDVKPNTNYRVTALAGHYTTLALPTTGQWKVHADTNILEFNAWSN